MKHKTIIRIGIAVCICTCFLGCSKTDKNTAFKQQLDTIDLLIKEGDTDQAIKKLHSLRRKASLPIHYLSIAKRELRTRVPAQALQTLQEGLKKHSGHIQLKAALVHTLLKEKRFDDTVSYAADLENTAYASIGTEAFIKRDEHNGTHETPIPFWKEGFSVTGEQVFLENAGLLLAYQGNLEEAVALRSSIPKGEATRAPYFWSCLAYDLGQFNLVFTDLFYSLVYADMAGLPENDPNAFEYARRHLLLAADASAGLKKPEQARGFWQTYIDRFPDQASDILYNLAMTAPTEKEKITVLNTCITDYPHYYPAVGQYVRLWYDIYNRNVAQNTLTALLQSKDFYSLEMENTFLLYSVFTVPAEELLTTSIANNAQDERFLLELFRYHYVLTKDYTRGIGALWKLMEQHPQSSLIKSYARWYFARFGDINAAFTVEGTEDKQEYSFYEGIRSAINGESEQALSAFSKAELDERYSTAAVINQAYIYAARNESRQAVEYFTRGAQMTEDLQLQSKLLYEAARIFAERGGNAEALPLLRDALARDAENQRAAVLLRKLQNNP